MDMSDRRANESVMEWLGRKHDERHGPVCDCLWARAHGRGMPVPGVSFDSVPEGKRVVLYKGDRVSS